MIDCTLTPSPLHKGRGEEINEKEIDDVDMEEIEDDTLDYLEWDFESYMEM